MSLGQTLLRARVKEEPEEPSIKQEEEQLPVSVPESSAVCVKREEPSELQQRQTEHREETHSETEGQTEPSSDTDNDDDWEPFKCSAAKSTGLFPKYRPVPETSAPVKEEELSGAAGAEVKKHQCPFCRKRFAMKRVLQDHVRVHTGERPYSCSICERTFIQKSTLQRHMVTHTGAEGKHRCSVCEKKFHNKHDLLKHVRAHTGERLYSCSACEKRFTQKCHLQRHMRIHPYRTQTLRGPSLKVLK